MPNPYWFDLPIVQQMQQTGDGSLGMIAEIAARHETLEHARATVRNLQSDFDDAVTRAAAAGINKADLGEVLDLSRAAIDKILKR